MGARTSKEEIKKHYNIKYNNKLGSGSFATVYPAIRMSDQKQFAVKIIKKKKLQPEEVRIVHEEVEIMHKIRHPNCVMLYEMFENPKKLYMVMEVLSGGELFDRIVSKGSFSEAEAANVISAVAGALQYLHSHGIVHRDLKPENLLLSGPDDDAVVKITDFGLAKFRINAREAMHTACGTPGYVAPEVLLSLPYGPAVDVWSLGVILYILLCGFPPFFHHKTTELYKLIKAGKVNFPDEYWRDISPEAKNLVLRMLTVDPAKRITPSEILKTPWVVDSTVASKKSLGSNFTAALRVLQARAKLRRTVQAIVALNKFKKQIDGILAE